MARRGVGHLRLVSGRDSPRSPPALPPPSSSITIEIDASGVLRKLEINLRKEDALQALNALVMAHMRALGLLTN